MIDGAGIYQPRMSHVKGMCMDRQSDKHNPKKDEEMKQEVESLEQGAPVESRAEEVWTKEEPSTSGEADRAEVARFLEPAVFPADRDRLVASAHDMQAPDAVLQLLRRLPDRRYADFAEVWQAAEELAA